MMQLTSKALVRAGLALATCLLLRACGSLNAGGTSPPFRDSAMSMQNAYDAMVVGKTTQDEAMAALGPATEIKFDSGYAVWVYRARAPTDRKLNNYRLLSAVVLFSLCQSLSYHPITLKIPN